MKETDSLCIYFINQAMLIQWHKPIQFFYNSSYINSMKEKNVNSKFAKLKAFN